MAPGPGGGIVFGKSGERVHRYDRPDDHPMTAPTALGGILR